MFASVFVVFVLILMMFAGMLIYLFRAGKGRQLLYALAALVIGSLIPAPTFIVMYVVPDISIVPHRSYGRTSRMIQTMVLCFNSLDTYGRILYVGSTVVLIVMGVIVLEKLKSKLL